MEQIVHWLNEIHEELRMKQWCLYLHSSFSFVQYYAIKAEIGLELQPFISEDQNKKNAQLIRSFGKRLTTQIQVMAGKHG